MTGWFSVWRAPRETGAPEEKSEDGGVAWRWYLSNAGRAVAVLAALGVMLLLAWWLLWYEPMQVFEEIRKSDIADSLARAVELRDRVRATGAQMLLGVAVIAGAILTWWRVKILERRADSAERQAQSAQDQVKVAQDGQVTERFTRAIEQLGSKESAICLGGIYALERTARDSERDHPQVMEVLCAFVREETRQIGSDNDPEAEPPRPSTTVQAALDVIGRNPLGSPEGRVNLAGAQIPRARLSGALLSGVDLSGAVLDKAILSDADLSGANLSDASLNKAVLARAELSFAQLPRAKLVGARLFRANLSNAQLPSAILSEAVLLKANLQGAYLEEAHLREATLRGADLSGVALLEADLSEANLSKSVLKKALFFETELSGANLSDADLTGAHLYSVDLTQVVGLTREQVAAAHVDDETKLPKELQREPEESEEAEEKDG